MAQKELSIFWFRRDLRLRDNMGLFHALKEAVPVLPLFIFDTSILDKLNDREDKRVAFIYQALQKMEQELQEAGSSLKIANCLPLAVFKELIKEYNIKAVYTNHDYEPYARKRDEEIRSFLEKHNITFNTFKDQCIFEKDEITKDDGKPYTIFTPYSRKWKQALEQAPIKEHATGRYFSNFLQTKPFHFPSLKQIGFSDPKVHFHLPAVSEHTIRNYKATRDIPAEDATSHLSHHLRFGTVSIRSLVKKASAFSETWLNELIWREFFMMILWHFPHVEKDSFKSEYDRIQWRYNEREFEAWCKGMTGFPIVDAGMRELNASGFMHNRVRMITASFLVKDLLIDWRWGEAYFAEKLLDYDLSANNGNWQWAAGCGCDSAPYFRIFNPDSQQKKFDPDFLYIKKWIPEYGTDAYPKPIVDHAEARERTLKAYKAALNEGRQPRPTKQAKLF